MKPVHLRLLAAVAAVGLAVGMAALPAQASTRSHAFGAIPGGAHPDISSDYIAGFTNEVAGSGSVESMTIPAIDCSAGDSGIAVGMGVEAFDNPTATVMADVYATCSGGVASYSTDVLVNGRDKQGAAAAGDVVAFSVTFKKGKAIAVATNTTNPDGTVKIKGTSDAGDLHFGGFPLFDNGTLMAVPTFTTFRLVKAYVVGAPLNGANCLRYQRYNGSLKEIDVTDTIHLGSNQGSFSIVFKHN